VAVVVVGGQSRSVGKTSVVAGLIARLPQMRWTAFKITQYGHGFCTANGAPCACATADHTIAISEERSASSGTDTARFLAAGASRSIWVRTRQGMLAEAMPRIQKELATAENAILESNSILQFLEPDLYLTVLDSATADFKTSARHYLDRADALLIHSAPSGPPESDIFATLPAATSRFLIAPPDYLTSEIVDYVRRIALQVQE
jgi:molybdopterin-guanine dinucleotide biosynthesis protein